MQQVFSELKLINLNTLASEKKNSENNIPNVNSDSNSLNSLNDSLFIPYIELLDGSQYHKTNIYLSKRISKRISLDNNELCFKEFTPSGQYNDEETQLEIKKQVDIIEELTNFDHIIKFYGVAQEGSKYYLITEWMEHGNLHEYYTRFRDNINLETKIKFALD